MKKALIFFALFAAALLSCSKKDDNVSPTVVVPTVTTSPVTEITSNSAKSGGDITSDGGSGILGKGVVWSTTANPKKEDLNARSSEDGAGMGAYTSIIDIDILPLTLYHVRAWAMNSAGIAYGSDVTFTTTGPLPTVDTGGVTVTSTTGVVNSVVNSDGGQSVTARGLCYGTSLNPDITGTKTTDGTGTGSFMSTMTGLTTGTVYHCRAYATTSNGTGYGVDVAFTPVLTIGEAYQGGVIAYILQPGDPGYSASVTHGLIAAPSDQGTANAWSNTLTATGATNDLLGAGLANTNTIVNNQGAGTYAAKLCDLLVIGAYSDWYLPSETELIKLYLNRTAIGGFAVAFYWSSTEFSATTAWVQSFNSNSQSQAVKTDTYYVRAIRAF